LRAWLAALDVDFVEFVSRLDEQLRAHQVPDARFRAARRRSDMR
jgi:hypothetical protein